MNLVTSTENALLALVYPGRAEPDMVVSVETIANAQNSPFKFPEQILLTMKRARILNSCRGIQAHSKYCLADLGEHHA